MAVPSGAENSQEPLRVEADYLVLLDLDRTSFDTDAFVCAVGDVAVGSFGVSKEDIEQEQREAESTPGQSFNIVSCIRRALNGQYKAFEQALLTRYEPESFTYPDTLDGLRVLAAASIPVMAMTHGVVLDQGLKLATSPSLSRLPAHVIDAPNKGEILRRSLGDDGRYYLVAATSDQSVEFVAKWVAIADDKLENFAALKPEMRVIPFYLSQRSRTQTNVKLDIAPVEVSNLRQVADYVVALQSV